MSFSQPVELSLTQPFAVLSNKLNEGHGFTVPFVVCDWRGL